MLLAAGADARLKSKGGTAKEWALRFGHAEAAEMLQEHEDAQQEAVVAAEGAVALSHYQVACACLYSYGAMLTRWPLPVVERLMMDKACCFECCNWYS